LPEPAKQEWKLCQTDGRKRVLDFAHVTFLRISASGWKTPAGRRHPIATFTWLLLYKKYSAPEKMKALRDFITYSLTDGQKLSEELGYVPLPANVVEKSKAALATVE
jgi:ABC-type phosphate transport system substrate-binding protein